MVCSQNITFHCRSLDRWLPYILPKRLIFRLERKEQVSVTRNQNLRNRPAGQAENSGPMIHITQLADAKVNFILNIEQVKRNTGLF